MYLIKTEKMKLRRHSVIVRIRIHALRFTLSFAAFIKGTRLCNGFAIFKN